VALIRTAHAAAAAARNMYQRGGRVVTAQEIVRGFVRLVHGEVFRDTKFVKLELGKGISTFLLNLHTNPVQKLEKAERFFFILTNFGQRGPMRGLISESSLIVYCDCVSNRLHIHAYFALPR
jgi:hypothetical protein